MNIKETFNVKEGDILKKKFNILIPICLGNKFFITDNKPTKNVNKYISFAISHTKEKVLILIADKIQDTNYFVRGKRATISGSRERVISDGKKIKTAIENIVKVNFPNSHNIEVISYQEYQEQDQYSKDITILAYKEFKNNPDFAQAIMETVKTTQKDKSFSKNEYLRLSDYILDEFALVYTGVTYKQDYFGLFIYPQIDSTVYFIENIKYGNLFKEFSKNLPSQKIGLAIVNEEKHESESFYDKISPVYTELINGRDVKAVIHNEIVKVCKKYNIESGSILDIGCGPGNLKNSFKDSVGNRFSYTGIDISKKMLNITKASGYSVIYGYIEEILPILPSKSFDYVIASSSLQFVKDIKKVISEIERIATKGLIISLDQMTPEYKKGFKTVCSSNVYDHYDFKINNAKIDKSFSGWISPRERKNLLK
jgi:ubiquinone/menaquinone biosynthesis C-methylase UbiE